MFFSSNTWDSSKDIPDLTGKVAIVTGGNTGIGRECVRQLAIHGAKVYMASRTESRAVKAIEEIQTADSKTNGQIHFLKLDLADLRGCKRSAKEFLEKESRLDILINNAGIMATPYELTDDGIEGQFQSNHLGHFAFTQPLLPLLVQTSKIPDNSVHIVQVTSNGHSFAASGPTGIKFETIDDVNRDFGSTWKRYGQSKLSNILFAKELAKRYKDERIYSNATHPGGVQTELNRGTALSYPRLKFLLPFLGPFLLSTYKGAITTLFAATAPEIETKNTRGQYLVPMAKVTTPSTMAQDEKLATQLWELSERIIAEKTADVQ